VSAGAVTLQATHVQSNSVTGGDGGKGGPKDTIAPKGKNGVKGEGHGGGVFIVATDSQVRLDAASQANTTGNKASTDFPNIDGPWQPL
jgi:hypothetical protein